MTSSWKMQGTNKLVRYNLENSNLPQWKVCLAIALLWLPFLGYNQSPHGDKLKRDCAQCHAPESWAYSQTTHFSHEQTGFALQGQHSTVKCLSCHPTLKFEDARNTCVACHEDVHQQSVGTDCMRCHGTDSWVVADVTKIHEQASFPLVGNHSTFDCARCHENQTTLRFGPLPLDCAGCHLKDYQSAARPNHIKEHYPTSCESCHSVIANGWASSGVNHQFFPLEQGHSNLACTQCHKQDTYTGLNPDCIQCHQQDYLTATNPKHQSFPEKCTECHTLASGWRPARFDNHDSVFPIYSGNHKGEWNACTDCHTIPSNFNSFSCIDCHEHNNASDMAEEHDDVRGYSFSSQACFQCHPKGG
jgi:hypothetical protein